MKIIEGYYADDREIDPKLFDDPFIYDELDVRDDVESAIEEYCRNKDRNSADYIIIGNGSTTVFVQDDDGVIEKYTVSAWSEPIYSARRAK